MALLIAAMPGTEVGWQIAAENVVTIALTPARAIALAARETAALGQAEIALGVATLVPGPGAASETVPDIAAEAQGQAAAEVLPAWAVRVVVSAALAAEVVVVAAVAVVAVAVEAVVAVAVAVEGSAEGLHTEKTPLYHL
jgi:hypothetical protein